MILKDHSDCCMENGCREAKWNKETSEEAAERVMDKGGRNGDGERWKDSGHILKVTSVGTADGM